MDSVVAGNEGIAQIVDAELLEAIQSTILKVQIIWVPARQAVSITRAALLCGAISHILRCNCTILFPRFAAHFHVCKGTSD